MVNIAVAVVLQISCSGRLEKTYLDRTEPPVDRLASLVISGGQVADKLNLLGLPDVGALLWGREGNDGTCVGNL
jgi:hypothetical protein